MFACGFFISCIMTKSRICVPSFDACLRSNRADAKKKIIQKNRWTTDKRLSPRKKEMCNAISGSFYPACVFYLVKRFSLMLSKLGKLASYTVSASNRNVDRTHSWADPRTVQHFASERRTCLYDCPLPVKETSQLATCRIISSKLSSYVSRCNKKKHREGTFTE